MHQPRLANLNLSTVLFVRPVYKNIPLTNPPTQHFPSSHGRRGCKTLFYFSIASVIIVQVSFSLCDEFWFFCVVLCCPLSCLNYISNSLLLDFCCKRRVSKVLSIFVEYAQQISNCYLQKAISHSHTRCALQMRTVALFYGIYLHFFKCDHTRVSLCSAMKHAFVDSRLLLLLCCGRLVSFIFFLVSVSTTESLHSGGIARVRSASLPSCDAACTCSMAL
ncbi:hypothetical protein TRVL_06879 [Trypanosoma vivax]|nr:hypothetical protein TRVL_06879 [Trypanosoma vivax]